MTQITIPNVPTEVTYSVITSQTGPFTVPFAFFDEADVKATVTNAAGVVTNLVHSTDFTFASKATPVGQEGSGYTGGTITLNSAIGADGATTLLVYRDTVIDRTANYPNTGPFSMPLLNDEQNKHIAIMQELEENIADGDATNAAAIATNAANITTNANNISNNTTGIAVNAAGIASISAGLPTAGVITNESWTGDGTTVDYTLSVSPPSANSLLVTLDGVMQEPGIDFSLAGAVVTFGSAPPLNADIVIRNFGYATQVQSVDSVDITYAITAAETSAGVTPVNYEYEPGNVLRYGTNTTPGTTDMTTAINNAISAATPTAALTFYQTAGGNTVYLPAGVYAITGNIDVPGFVNLKGDGKGLTTIKCTGASGQITYGTVSGAFGSSERGGASGGFTLDGNNTNTGALLHLGLVVERDFHDIEVFRSGSTGLLVEAAQNCNFYGCGFQYSGDVLGNGSNIKLDYGAGNIRFYGCEVNYPGKYNIEFVQSGTSPSGAFAVPTDNRFYGCMIERWEDADGGGTVTALGTIYHGAGSFNRFNDCDISLTLLPSALSCVTMRKDGSPQSNLLFFHNNFFAGTTGQSTCFDLDDATTLYLTGTNYIQNHDKVFAVNDNGVAIHVDNVKVNAGTWWTGSGTANEDQTIQNTLADTYHKITRAATTNPAIRTYVDGDGFSTPRFEARADGNLKWGSGSASTDTNLYRGAANRLQTDDQIYAIGGVRRGVTAGITADTGSAQGGSALTKDINEVSTCANVGDSVTLPTAAPGLEVTIINNGANACDVFPASADNLGAGVNTAASLAAGANITYVAYDAVNWVAKT